MKKQIFLVLVFAFLITVSAGVRIKEIANFRGARDNQLFGLGLVTGLNGTGDSGLVTSELMTNIFKNMGYSVQSQFKTKNTAVVMVFADIPPFYKEGMKLDITVASIGDAKSLENGYLIQTPLLGADNKVYAVAQGAVFTGGADAKGSSNTQKKYRITGSVPQGAIVETEIPVSIFSDDMVSINLNSPDITTAARVAMAINVSFSEKIAKAQDPSTIRVDIPEIFKDDVISFLSLIEEVEVEKDQKAKIVLDEKTGTIILGGKVKVGDFSLSYGSFVLSVVNGQVGEKEATVDNIIAALKAAGAVPQDILVIIKNASKAGYVMAELVVI